MINCLLKLMKSIKLIIWIGDNHQKYLIDIYERNLTQDKKLLKINFHINCYVKLDRFPQVVSYPSNFLYFYAFESRCSYWLEMKRYKFSRFYNYKIQIYLSIVWIWFKNFYLLTIFKIFIYEVIWKIYSKIRKLSTFYN